jgi:hypothetical protein
MFMNGRVGTNRPTIRLGSRYNRLTLTPQGLDNRTKIEGNNNVINVWNGQSSEQGQK